MDVAVQRQQKDVSVQEKNTDQIENVIRDGK
jgi:hypothetical protein